jgi:hypothetical protein
MKQVLKAKSPGDMLFQLNRSHDILISLIFKDESKVINHKLSSGAYCLDDSLNALHDYIECAVNGFSSIKRISKKLDNYKKAIKQTKYVVSEKRKGSKYVNTTRNSFQFLKGEFEKLRKEVKKLVSNSCESNYQNYCAPLFLVYSEFK